MRSIKILLGSSFLVFFILIIVIFTTAASADDPVSSVTDSEPTERKRVDKAVIQRYKRQQQYLKTEIQTYFKNAIVKGDIVGAGVSIVKGDSIVISEGYGKRSIDKNEKVNGKTIFRLGSLSKGFTGVLMAGLHTENTLDFNDRVVDYLPNFQLGDIENTQKITLGHILSHSSGTPYHSYTNLVEAGLPMNDIASRFDKVNPISAPGEMYSYQNAMFALSQEIIKKASGEDIATALKNRFFIPLRMTSVSMDHNTLTKAHNVALPHTRWRKGFRARSLNDHYYNAIAAGGINASSLDMAKWMRFLLGHNPEVLPQSAMQEAFCPAVKISYNNKYYQRWKGHLQSYYGYGWRIHTFNDAQTLTKKTMWHHGGSVNNYRNEIALYPEEDLGICVLFNSNARLARHVIPDLYELVRRVYAETAEEVL